MLNPECYNFCFLPKFMLAMYEKNLINSTKCMESISKAELYSQYEEIAFWSVEKLKQSDRFNSIILIVSNEMECNVSANLCIALFNL